jgi:hypothetical protein
MTNPSPDVTIRPVPGGGWASVRRFVQRTLIVISSVVIAISVVALGFLVFFPTTAAEYTSGLRPSLFYAELPSDLIADDLDYASVIGIAHNSGDSVQATLAALAGGADAIEMDVVSLNGRLYSSHGSPLPLIGPAAFRGPSVEEIWAAAAQTDLVQFDLKESSTEFLELVKDFIVTHQEEHQIVVSSDDPDSLRYLADRPPGVLLFRSVGDQQDLTSLQEDPELAALIDGVTIRNDLVDEETARWMTEHDLHMIVWTVNDLGRANELVDLGVDGITTDNLALLGLFGGQQRGEAPLEPANATPAPEATPVSHVHRTTGRLPVRRDQ